MTEMLEGMFPMPGLSYNEEPVYLADAEPHLPEPFRAAADLRARVILHVLFADTLVLGDSQSLNNPYLRELLTTESGRPYDLAALINDGFLRIARRNNFASFLAIRNNHAERNVKNVPSPQYAEWLDEITSDHLIHYDGNEVADRFKSGVCDLLEKEAVRSDGLQKTVLRQAQEWVRTQDPLNYNDVRNWQAAYRDRSTAALLALRIVEESTSLAYRSALPSTLHAAVADRRSVLRLELRNRTDLAELRLPPTLLSVSTLSKIPIEVIQETLLLPSRQVALRELVRIRHGDVATPNMLEAVTDFAETFHQLALQNASPTARAALQWHDTKLRFALTMSERDGGYGAAFGAISTEAVPAPGFFELFSQPLSITADDVPETKGDLDVDAISRGIAPTDV